MIKAAQKTATRGSVILPANVNRDPGNTVVPHKHANTPDTFLQTNCPLVIRSISLVLSLNCVVSLCLLFNCVVLCVYVYFFNCVVVSTTGPP